MTTMAIDNKEKEVLNVPHLRFPEFSGEWYSYPLTDFMSFKNGMNPDAKRFGHGTKFISVMDILNNQFIRYDNIRASVEVIAGDIETYGVNYGDILFQRSSETLEDVGQANVYLDSKPAVFGGFVIRGKSKGNYHPMFFRYLLASPTARKRIIVKGAGAQHFNIGQDGLSKVYLDIPSIQEQEKIAKLLECIDDRIATQNKIIEKLQSLIKGLNDSLYKQYGNAITTSFSDLGHSYSGLSGKSSEDFGSGKPFITYLNVYSNSVVNENEYQYVRINDGEKQNIVQCGDVLFTLSSETPEEVGVGSVYLGIDEVFLNSFCFGFHIDNKELAYPPYFSYYVSSTPFRKFIYPFAQGSTRFNLCKADFEKASIKLPSLNNQKHIYAILNSITEKIETEKNLLEYYTTQKQYLLRQMFI